MSYVTDDTPLDVEMAPGSLTALRSAGETIRSDVQRMLERRARRGWPHPGGACREMTIEREVTLFPFESLELRLPSSNEGRSITLVHRLPYGASLHSGRFLRIPDRHVPDTILTAASGMTLGELVDVRESSLAVHADVAITAIANRDDNGKPCLSLEIAVPTVRPKLGDLRRPRDG